MEKCPTPSPDVSIPPIARALPSIAPELAISPPSAILDPTARIGANALCRSPFDARARRVDRSPPRSFVRPLVIVVVALPARRPVVRRRRRRAITFNPSRARGGVHGTRETVLEASHADLCGVVVSQASHADLCVRAVSQASHADLCVRARAVSRRRVASARAWGHIASRATASAARVHERR